MASRASNGCMIASRVSRKNAGYKPLENIAAIDFGTTNCSLAYTIDKSDLKLLALRSTLKRVPTAVLFDKDGNVEYFGEDAREEYGNLEDDERLKHAYFEHIKMNLQNDKVGYTL